MKPSLRDLAILFTILALGLLIAGIVVLTHAPKDMVKAKTTEKEARCSCVPVKEDLPHRSDPHPRYCGRDVIKQTTTGCPDWAIYFVCRTTTWPDHDILWTKHFEFGDVTSLTKVEDGGSFQLDFQTNEFKLLHPMVENSLPLVMFMWTNNKNQ